MKLTLGVHFSHCNDEILTKILFHSFRLINFILVVEDNLLFAALSEQVIFFFYFGEVMFLKAVKHARDNNKLNCVSEIDNSFNDKDWQAALISVELIIDRFDLIAT